MDLTKMPGILQGGIRMMPIVDVSPLICALFFQGADMKSLP